MTRMEKNMLLSIALMFIVGMIFGELAEKLRLPKLLGMLFAGILLGPSVLNLMDVHILNISDELQEFALIVILVRAGFSLDFDDLKQIGRPALLLSFLPAVTEIIGAMILAPWLLGVSLIDAAIIGAVLAAVSPAVVVPRMVTLMEEGYGQKKRIPQMIVAGSSIDDIVVIVIFTALLNLAKTASFSFVQFLSIPTSIIFGVIGGLVLGKIMSLFFKKFDLSNIVKVIILLSVAFILVTIEGLLTGAIGFSGLLAVMALAAMLRQEKPKVAEQMDQTFSSIWVGAEVLLFVLVGSNVHVHYVLDAGLVSTVLILGALLFRFIGIFMSLIKTGLNLKEQIYTIFAYIPKATVQAAIGGIPLAMGMASGEIILTVAVVSIIVTAPLGAILMDASYKKLLTID